MTDEEIARIYNRFTDKDLPFHEFKKQVRELTDPQGIQRDLAALQFRRKLKI